MFFLRMKSPQKYPLTTGLCAGVALEFLPPETTARLFAKDKCLGPMFGDVRQARTNAAMLLMPIATTSSRTCTKPIVACWLVKTGIVQCYLNGILNCPFVMVEFVTVPLYKAPLKVPSIKVAFTFVIVMLIGFKTFGFGRKSV